MDCKKVIEAYPTILFEPCCDCCHEDETGEILLYNWININNNDLRVCCAIARTIHKEILAKGKLHGHETK